MRIGIVGLPHAGRKTVFEALRGAHEATRRGSHLLCTIRVPDERVDFLSGRYKPKKTTYAQVEYLMNAAEAPGEKNAEALVRELRDADAVLMVVRNFANGTPAAPAEELKRLSSEMVFSDFMVMEKRKERIEADRKRGKKTSAEETELVDECLALLERDEPLRRRPELAGSPLLKSFGLVSAKPLLALLNNADEDQDLPDLNGWVDRESLMVVRGKLEQELAGMTSEDAAEFRAEFGIAGSALKRVVLRSYQLLGLISFFTVGDDEVKAWTVRRGAAAVDAAEAIHSDIKKGFIRAEVLDYPSLVAAGNYQEAKKLGKVRLEGKTYEVQDGDIVNFRFNV